MADHVLAALVVNLCGKRLSDWARARVFEQCGSKGIFVIEDNCHYLVPRGLRPRPDMEMQSFGFGKVLSATAGGALIARLATAEIDTELQRQHNPEPAPAALSRFRYFMARFAGGTVPAEVEAAY